MKESEEIRDYLDLDGVEKMLLGSEIHLVKENFTVIIKAVDKGFGLAPWLRVTFVPPKSHYEEQKG